MEHLLRWVIVPSALRTAFGNISSSTEKRKGAIPEQPLPGKFNTSPGT